MDAAPSVGCSWDRHKEGFLDTGGQTEIALNVTLLIEIDLPFYLFVKTKQNKKILKGKADQTRVCMPHMCSSGGIPEEMLLPLFYFLSSFLIL